MQLPVVFVHQGKQKYLKCVIKLAERRNEYVYLIGDSSNRTFCKRWLSNQSFDLQRFYKFSRCYKHMSSNPFEFELNCFKRFYLLKAFMEAENLEKCVMLDSDLCVYITFIYEYFNKYDVALAVPEKQDFFRWSASPHCSYWTIESLENFICFCERTYLHDLKILEEKWTWHKQNNIKGGICDMTLLYLWINKNNINYLNTTICRNDMVFDNKFGCAENYLIDEYVMDTSMGIKKTIFKDGIPYFFMKKDLEEKRALAIHCQGSSKKYIFLLARCISQRWPYIIIYKYNQILFIMKLIVKSFIENK